MILCKINRIGSKILSNNLKENNRIKVYIKIKGLKTEKLREEGKYSMEEEIQDSSEKKRFAVLIDSDNISAKYAEIIFNELSEYGLANTRRIYGNWAKGNGWNETVLLENSIMPIQQFNYTTGKNSTDMTMVIDAMDILYSGKVDGFCLVTSDSDFTRLAMRLREENKFIIGMGESKTPDSLKKSCNKFIYLDLVAKHNDDVTEGDEKKKDKKEITKLKDIEQEINNMIAKSSNGKVGMSQIGSRLVTLFPDFDVRNYGYIKLSTLIGEKFTNLKLVQNGIHYSVTKEDAPSKEEVEEQVVEILKEAGGKVSNMSFVYNKLKEMYPGFSAVDYGHSKISNLMKSMKNVKVVGNTVTLKNFDKISTPFKKELDSLNQEIIEMLRSQKEMTTSQIHNELRKRHEDFDIKNYGYKKMSSFIRNMEGVKLSGIRVVLVKGKTRN